MNALRWPGILLLTLGLGLAVAISWMTFFRLHPPLGLDAPSFVHPVRLAILGTQVALVGGFGYALGRSWLRATAPSGLGIAVAAAWLLEGLILTAIGEPLVANEINPLNAWYFWLVATGGPVQPMAAFAGGALGLRHAIATG